MMGEREDRLRRIGRVYPEAEREAREAGTMPTTEQRRAWYRLVAYSRAELALGSDAVWEAFESAMMDADASKVAELFTGKPTLGELMENVAPR